MIIKGLFHKYKRWNPVHPTTGAFWGMGLGIGCGVGWGPGFGPEVVGYVGSGCGVGFSVGITFAGVGIGLPANFILGAPFNAVLLMQRNVVKAAKSMGEGRNGGLDDKRIREFQRQASEKLSRMLIFDSLSKRVDAGSMRSMLSFHSKPDLENLNTIQVKHSDQDDRKK